MLIKYVISNKESGHQILISAIDQSDSNWLNEDLYQLFPIEELIKQVLFFLWSLSNWLYPP